LENVFIHRDLSDRSETVTAKRGFLYQDKDGERYLILEEGRRVSNNVASNARAAVEVVNFTRYGIRLDVPGAAAFTFNERARSTLALMREPTAAGGGELFWRFSMPIAGLIMVFAAIPLSYVNPRMGRSYNIILGILLFAVYFNLMNIVQAQVSLGHLHWIVALVLLHGGALMTIIALFYRRYQGATFWKYVRFWERNENAAALSR
jgi:lipopolysaccharide export system permease protein